MLPAPGMASSIEARVFVIVQLAPRALSVRDIAGRCGFDHGSVRNAVRRLLDAGLFLRVGSRNASVYCCAPGALMPTDKRGRV